MITVDPRKPAAQAVAIKNGRFLMAGTDAEIQALSGRSTEVIDLKGRTVTPGFIDSHQHLFEYGTNLLQLDCSPKKCRSIADIKKARPQRNPPESPGGMDPGRGV